MTDCPNSEMRDRLPDLLHERLDAGARAAVIAHVGECADCTAELGLLRQVRVSLSSGMVAIDAAAIARTVVTRTSNAAVISSRRRRWTDWRLAAAVAVLAVGGVSVATVYGTRSPNESRIASPAVMAPPRAIDSAAVGTPPGAATPPRGAAVESNVPKTRAELATAGDVSELSENELRTLLGDLDSIEAVPPTDPEPVAVRVTLPERSGSD